VAVLTGLQLLPDNSDYKKVEGFSSAFRSPPASIALIEAGATAASKWWAAGLGGGVLAAWAAVRGWWGGASPGNQHVALWVAAIVTAAAVLGIAYLLGSDVRGRAAVATETVRARAAVATAYVRERSPAELRIVPLPGLPVKHTQKSGPDEKGWKAVALATDTRDTTRYLVVKDIRSEWVTDGIEFA
jgi:hypothetical protein